MEKERAEAAQCVSEERFRQLAENISDVFFLIDTDSHRVSYISPAYEEIWGRSCESLYANPELWIEVVHPEDRASTYGKYKVGISGGKSEWQYPDRASRRLHSLD